MRPGITIVPRPRGYGHRNKDPSCLLFSVIKKRRNLEVLSFSPDQENRHSPFQAKTDQIIGTCHVILSRDRKLFYLTLSLKAFRTH